MQGIGMNLVTVGRCGITSAGRVVSGKVMDCPRPFGFRATVVRSLDGKFRKWNPIVQVVSIK